MSSNEADEEILLYSAERATTSIDSATLTNITAKISQINKWKHTRKALCIYDNKILGINDYCRNSTKKFWLHLIHIDPIPRRHKSTPWGSYLTASLMLVIGMLLLTHKVLNILPNLSFNYQASSAVLLITLAVILSLIATYRSTNELIFFTLHGQVPIFSIFYKRPNKKAYQAFLKHIITAITAAKSKEFYNRSEQLAVELGEHRRLNKEGVLSAEIYAQAKNNIMQCH